MRKSNKLFKTYYVLYVMSVLSLLLLSHNTSALEYGSSTNIQFTFNPTISMNLSSSDLVIPNLSPGSYADSNIITISVDTNNSAGYTLSATVGNSNGIGNGRNSTDLVNISNSNYKFTSLSSNAATLDALPSNAWGYSYSTDNGTTWISGSAGNTATGYNGLTLDSNNTASELGKGGVSLLDYNTVSNNNSVKFKIGAKADAELPAGTYTNTINFYAVTKVVPMSISDAFAAANKTQLNGYYKMQDMTTDICKAVQLHDEESQTELIDERDGKIYWVAKVKSAVVTDQDDGYRCWMTQNLDLNLDKSIALTSNDTDLNEYNVNGYLEADGYSCSNDSTTENCKGTGEVISWTPERDTINAITDETTNISSITAYQNDANNPYSVDPGNWYWKGEKYSSGQCPSVDTTSPTYIGCNYMSKRTTDNNGTSVTNRWATYFSTSPYASINGTHGHVGNYYNWASSIASNNAAAYASSTISDTANNPKNSVCPAGWRLPVITSYTSSEPYAVGTNEFYNLEYYYHGGARGTDYGIIVSPLYFVRAGVVSSHALYYAGNYGYYWSSTVASSTTAYRLGFNSGNLTPQSEANRLSGRSLRCIAR